MNQEKQFNDDMDRAFPNGVFTEPNGKVPNIRFRDMHNWCEEMEEILSRLQWVS